MRAGNKLARRWLFAVGLLACAAATACAGLDPEADTDNFDPGAESYRLNEARRLNNVARQLDLVYRMQWEYPYFPGEPPIRQPIGYESKQVAPNRWIYRPIYPEDVAAEPETLPPPDSISNPAQPQGAAQAPAPADARPGDLIPPQENPLRAKPARPRKAQGPREF